MQVQEEMVRRVKIQSGKCGKNRVYISKYVISSIVYCGRVVTFTAGYIGTTEVISLLSGDVSAAWRKRDLTAPPLP